MERIVVSTGRCGSTLLSNMLAYHPDVLVVTEFFKAFECRIDCGGKPISGQEFARLLSMPYRIIDLTVHRRFISKEILHRLEGIDLEELSIPMLMMAALPSLTNQPEKLFAESIAHVCQFPVQQNSEHCRQYFDWLTMSLGKSLWVERSGASIELMPEFIRMYPDAKYVHIHRDGLEASLSMREHPFFRLYVSFLLDPPTVEELSRTELAGQPITEADPVTERMVSRQPTLEQFGDFWSQQLEVGFAEFLKLKPGQLLTISFEDLLRDPAGMLQAVATFFEFPDRAGWIESACGLVSKGVECRAPQLSSKDRAALERGCRTGQRLLGRSGPWPGIDRALDTMNIVQSRR